MSMITTEEQLEGLLGQPALGVRMKIIDHLDETARAWLAASPLAFVGAKAGAGLRVSAAAVPPGFALASDETRVLLPLAALDTPQILQPGAGAGALFLAPQLGETLRLSGRIARVDDATAELVVTSCFVHCAKALIRSAFWSAPAAEASGDARACLSASSFLAFATTNPDGGVDISPKGDPAGFLLQETDGAWLLAERPGNRLAMGHRNILRDPSFAALAMTPGALRVVHVAGTARLSTEDAARTALAVDGKVPVLVSHCADAALEAQDSPALARAGLWSAPPPPAAIDPAATLVAHLNLNKEKGAAAAAIRQAVGRDGVQAGLAESYAKTLY